MEPLQRSFEVECPVERAFELWSRRMSVLWPRGHSVSADPGITVIFEPRAGGRIFERTPAGEEHDWGEVLVWEQPRRLVYLWHLRFDRSDATEVEVSFEPAGEGTEVTIVHRGRERLGAVAEERRERNRRGWGGLAEHYRAACAAAA
jgi:uncharacterized protein YndB with AHSA1/START domain